MELRHVVAFVTVAEELHFGRAADRLGIAQPAVSRLVRRLEADLDVTLFERTSHRVSLTAVGAQLLDHAQTIVAEHARLVAAATALSRGEGGLLRLGTTEAMSAQLDVLLARFATLKPTVRVELHPAHTPRKLELLGSGELDVAIVREAQPTPGLRIEPLWSDPLVAVLPASHPHAATEPLDRVRLDLPLLLIARDSSPGVHDALRAAAGTPGELLPFRGQQEALAMIAAGRAWTILQANAAPNTPGIAVRPLAPPAALTVGLAWRPTNPSPLVHAFTTTALAARDNNAL